VGSFVANLPEMLGAMGTDPRTIVTVVEFSDGRYWQCWADRDSTMIIEIVSNLNISGDAPALSELDEGRLREMGFMEPSTGLKPNWRVESLGVGELVRLVSMTRNAVYDVLRECSQNVVEVRSWEFRRPADCTRDEIRLDQSSRETIERSSRTERTPTPLVAPPALALRM
jgi:hypothetical protein